MKSGFVELVVKNTLAGRSAPKLTTSGQRYKPADSFKKYMTDVLPTIQEAIEISILKKTLAKLPSAKVRRQLINSYLHRLFRLRIYERDATKGYKQDFVEGSKRGNILIDPTIIKDVSEHNAYDQGSYALFTNQDMETVFKHGCFGEYHKKEYDFTKKFGVMLREESLTIAQGMKKIQNQKDIDWNHLKTLQSDQLDNFINNQENYHSLFSTVSNQIYQKVQKYRGHEEYMRIWGTSVVTDILTNSILQNSARIQDLDEYVNQAIQYVMQLEIKPSANDFIYRFKELPLSPVLPIKSEVPFYAQFFWRTPSMKNVFLGGEGGSGRSMILAYISMWAYKQNWIVINVPSGYRWTHDRTLTEVVRAYNGLFLVYEHAVEWLDQFSVANAHILKNMPVDQSIYGKYDISGIKEDEYQPVPNRWDPYRQTYTNQITEKVEGKLEEIDMIRAKAVRIIDVLPKPANLLELAQICQQGKNHTYSICVMGQLLNQVYQKDHPILQCVDGFSHFYRPSGYPSFRYFNDRGLYGKVPPYHIAHIRMFMHLDGHKIKKGLKVVASSNWPYFKHKFDIKRIMLPENYEHKVRNLNQKEFKSFGTFNILNKWWFADGVQRQNLGYMFTLAQGNVGDFQQIIKYSHYY